MWPAWDDCRAAGSRPVCPASCGKWWRYVHCVPPDSASLLKIQDFRPDTLQLSLCLEPLVSTQRVEAPEIVVHVNKFFEHAPDAGRVHIRARSCASVPLQSKQRAQAHV